MTPTIINVLNLGAGVQSTTLYLAAAYHDRSLAVRFDAAVFADTGEEPAAVYSHLAWLKSLGNPPIYTHAKGRLGDDLLTGMNGHGGRFVTIPAFTAPLTNNKAVGILRRQCTKEYKIEVIEQAIRYQILGLGPRQPVPKSIHLVQFYGISADEAHRAKRILANAAAKGGRPNWSYRFPLIELGLTRKDCIKWLEQYGKVPHTVPRSACVFCPYHTDAEWVRIKETDPTGWARAVAIDEGLRSGAIAQRGLNQPMYLHRTVTPLAQIQFAPIAGDGGTPGVETQECEGMCGN